MWKTGLVNLALWDFFYVSKVGLQSKQKFSSIGIKGNIKRFKTVTCFVREITQNTMGNTEKR